jgi:hypothetical protein
MAKFILFSVLSLVYLANTFATDSELWQGIWVLDSIQVNETSADGVIHKTLLPEERYRFESFRISRFTLDEANQTVSYSLTTGQSFDAMQYRLTPDGDLYKLFISGAPAVKYCSATLSSGSDRLLLEESFETYIKNQHINAEWRFYYHKL